MFSSQTISYECSAYRGQIQTGVGPPYNVAFVGRPTSSSHMTLASSWGLDIGTVHAAAMLAAWGAGHQMEWQAVTRTVASLERPAAAKHSLDVH